jgi:hypothetical protein
MFRRFEQNQFGAGDALRKNTRVSHETRASSLTIIEARRQRL